MSENINSFLKDHKCLLDEIGSTNGTRRFPIFLPELPDGRSIDAAWLDIPPNFSDGDLARVYLPKKYMLEVPHIENEGRLCIDGDPGPMSGATPEERIDQIIDLFYSSFLEPWSKGELDTHFSKEAMNYWRIYCSKKSNRNQPIVKIFTTDQKPTKPRVYKSIFIESRKLVIAGDDSPIKARYSNSLGNGRTISKVEIAEIPIAFTFTPINWPKNISDIRRLVAAKLGNCDGEKFFTSIGRRVNNFHKVVVFRAPGCSFGYLLPGGPPYIKKTKNSTKPFHSKDLLPLMVERLDVGWTTGRNQHPEHIVRQQKHVLIIGVGALGSPVAEQLAKSGVGKLTLVDNDNLCSANIGRHTLGANSIGYSKAQQLAQSISVRWPSCNVEGVSLSIDEWLKQNEFKDIDVILDLTGEPEVRDIVDKERKRYSTDCLIAWMEPYVAAAHACILKPDTSWFAGNIDRLDEFNAIDWPKNVIAREPACSSTFQSYTSAAALHAVALTTEAALDLIDNKVLDSKIRHWIRGKHYLDIHCPESKLRDWASFANDTDGVIRELNFD